MIRDLLTLHKARALRFLAVISLGAMALGCADLPQAGPASRQQSALLRSHLIEMSDRVNENEAQILADAAVEEAIKLAQEYRAIRPPWLHNVLVNNGLRERGLCFEWTNDLFERLYVLKSQTLELHLAVARMDTRHEHNAILVTAPGEPFESGVILDAWRASGRLWFGAVRRDKYPWVPLPPDRINPNLRALLGQPMN